MGSFGSALFLMMPLAGSVLLALGIFQVVMDMRTAKQRKVIDRLSESRVSTKERQVKENLVRKRATDVQKNFAEVILSRIHLVSRLQNALDQADLNWSASRFLLNITGLSLALGVGLLVFQVRPVVCGGVSLFVFIAPLFWLLHKRKRRIRQLIEQLPD